MHKTKAPWLPSNTVSSSTAMEASFYRHTQDWIQLEIWEMEISLKKKSLYGAIAPMLSPGLEFPQ